MVYIEGVTILGVRDIIVNVPSAIEISVTSIIKISVFYITKISVLSAIKISVLSLVIKLIIDRLVKVIAEVVFLGYIPGTIRGTISINVRTSPSVRPPHGACAVHARAVDGT